MFNKVSVLVPTRHRVERLKVLLASFEATALDKAELVFRTDVDDIETHRYLLPLTLADRCTIVNGSRHNGYDSMSTFFNEMAQVATGDVLMCGNDDMVFKTMHWQQLVLDEANKYPDGLFDIGVSTHNEAHFPFSIVSRKAVEHLGHLWDPAIFWGDIYLRDVMAWFGRAVPLPSVEIEHDWAGFRPDAVFNEADKNIVARNPTYWAVTHRQAVEGAVEKLRSLA